MSDTCRHCGQAATPGEVCPRAPWDAAQGRPSGQNAVPLRLTVEVGPAVDLVGLILGLVHGDALPSLIVALMRVAPACESAVRAQLLEWRRPREEGSMSRRDTGAR